MIRSYQRDGTGRPPEQDGAAGKPPPKNKITLSRRIYQHGGDGGV